MKKLHKIVTFFTFLPNLLSRSVTVDHEINCDRSAKQIWQKNEKISVQNFATIPSLLPSKKSARSPVGGGGRFFFDFSKISSEHPYLSLDSDLQNLRSISKNLRTLHRLFSQILRSRSPKSPDFVSRAGLRNEWHSCGQFFLMILRTLDSGIKVDEHHSWSVELTLTLNSSRRLIAASW